MVCTYNSLSIVKKKKRSSLMNMMNTLQSTKLSPRSKAGAKWLSKVKKGRQVAPKESNAALSVSQMRSPFGSQMSFALQTTRIEHVAEWEVIARKYRALVAHVDEVKPSTNTESEESENDDENNIQVPNNVAS